MAIIFSSPIETTHNDTPIAKAHVPESYRAARQKSREENAAYEKQLPDVTIRPLLKEENVVTQTYFHIIFQLYYNNTNNWCKKYHCVCNCMY
jgi:hypothetical protein